MTSFAAPFVEPAGSPIRELFPYLSRPGMISFAGGYPSPSLFDAEGLQRAAMQAIATMATIDRARLFDAAVDRRVLYVPGPAFYASDADPQTMRLSFAASSVEQIREGSQRLAQAFSAAVL